MSEPLGQRYKGINHELDRLSERGDIGSKYEELYKAANKIEGIIVDRNLKGKELEKKGKLDDAIKLYELNVTDEVDTPFPYERLAIIYHKQGKLQDEIGVLEKAAKIIPWSDKLRERLKKAKVQQL